MRFGAFSIVCTSLAALLLALPALPAKAQEQLAATKQQSAGAHFSFWDAEALATTRHEIAAGNPYFVAHYQKLLAEAEELLAFQPDPVVNKSIVPPSGDKHDYLSLAPYTWPNPDTPDGLPWIAKDGQINPMTRGSNTDQVRQNAVMEALTTLNLAYFLSGDERYGAKIRDIIRIWYLDPATRVNPNINFGQGIPGVNNGRPIGVIEWTAIRHVVTSVELLRENGLMPLDEQLAMRDWFTRYTDWLINSPIGIGEDNQPQNHGSWYDVQSLTLLIHLGRTEEARRRAEAAKTKRIAAQIEPDGSMPKENRRTKSVNYNSMNREAFVHIARLAERVGVDLMDYETEDGRSLKQAFRHLVPYARGTSEWTFQQIEYGGAAPAIERRMQPVMLFAQDVLEMDLLSDAMARDVAGRIGSVDALTFPPQVMLGGK